MENAELDAVAILERVDGVVAVPIGCADVAISITSSEEHIITVHLLRRAAETVVFRQQCMQRRRIRERAHRMARRPVEMPVPLREFI